MPHAFVTVNCVPWDHHGTKPQLKTEGGARRLIPPLDRAIVFPMAVVPNIWGLWNMLHLALRARVRWSIGAHGAILPLLLMPLGYALARSLEVFPPVQWELALPMAPVGATVYYLAWKYLVGSLNQEMGIA